MLQVDVHALISIIQSQNKLTGALETLLGAQLSCENISLALDFA